MLMVQVALKEQSSHPQVFVAHVTIVGAHSLPAMDKSGASDPFCVLRMLPAALCTLGDVKTKVIKKTVEPVWNESFDFVVNGDISQCVLRMQVWDKDQWSKSDPIGEAAFDFASVVEEMRKAGGSSVTMPKARIAVTRFEPSMDAKDCPRTLAESFKLLNIRASNDKAAEKEVKALSNFYHAKHKVYATKD